MGNKKTRPNCKVEDIPTLGHYSLVVEYLISVGYLAGISFEKYRDKLLSANLSGDSVAQLQNPAECAKFLSDMGINDPSHITVIKYGLERIFEHFCCSHIYLEKWGDNFHCTACKKHITDETRVLEENAEAERLGALDRDFHTQNTHLTPGDISHRRGIKISHLVEFTLEHQCFHLTTEDVRNRIIFPLTASRRCRYAELNHVVRKGVVGPAQTFVSHTWAGTWGDLVAAVSEGADPDRFVWVDVFAIQQWPSTYLDRDFASVIALCSSFQLVCSAVDEIADLHITSVNAEGAAALPPSARRKVAFFRVWCLVEINAAAQHPSINVLMKAGSHRRLNGGTVLRFVDHFDMIKNLLYMVDIGSAEATVPTDRERILADVERSRGGVNGLNRMVKATISGCAACVGDSVVQAAACGDKEPLAQLRAKPESIGRAAAGGYVDLVRELIAHCAVPLQLSNLQHALEGAARGGHVRCLEELVRAGADVNGTSGSSSVLSYAAGMNHIDAVKLLLSAGADPSAVGRDGMTALMWTASSGHAECLELLLNHTSGISTRDSSGMTALMWAAVSQDPRCLRLLLSRHADVTEQSNNGKTALMVAALAGNADCVKELLAYAPDTTVREQNGLTALLVTAAAGKCDCMRVQIEHGVDITEQDGHRRTALHLSVLCGSIECVEILLSHGSDLHAKDNTGCTPLMVAACKGHEHCVELLLRHGAVDSQCDKDGRTALMLAALNGKVNCVALLLAHPMTRKSGTGHDGCSESMIAASSGTVECMDKLLRREVDVSVRDCEGSTALLLAARYGCERCLTMLLRSESDPLERDSKNRTALILAATNGHKDCVEVLLSKVGDGSYLHCRDDHDCTALMWATVAGHAPCVQVLLSYGANVCDKNDKGMTPLMLGASTGRTQCVGLLLDHGASVREKDNAGKTAIELAHAAGRSEECVTLLCVALVLEYGES